MSTLKYSTFRTSQLPIWTTTLRGASQQVVPIRRRPDETNSSASISFFGRKASCLPKQTGKSRYHRDEGRTKGVRGKECCHEYSRRADEFFAACRGLKQSATFHTLQRAGLREMELATLRQEDIVLDSTKPYIDVGKRTVDGYEFVPNGIRSVMLRLTRTFRRTSEAEAYLPT